MGQIEKGVILSLSVADSNGNNSKASVQSTTANGTSTLPLTIPWYLRGSMGNLSKGTEVVYAVFDDATGLILSRMDGNWSGKMDDAGDITVGKLIADEVIAQSVQDSGITLHSHTHSGVEAGGYSTGQPE